MTKNNESELFITARSETEDKTFRTFDVYTEYGTKKIKEFDGFCFYTHYCASSVKTVADVIREIDNVYGCKVTSIKYPHLEEFQRLQK